MECEVFGLDFLPIIATGNCLYMEVVKERANMCLSGWLKFQSILELGADKYIQC